MDPFILKVRLGNDGISAIDDTLKLISRLKPSEVDTVEFQITASSIEHLDGEVFSADIFEAFKEGTGLPAYSGPALDSTAIVFIQNPADIALSVELENPLGQFSVGQEFTVSAHIYNSGTSGIDNSGRVRIVLPANYILLSIYDSSAISLTSPAQWTVKAPSIAQPLRELTVVLYQYPNDVNIGSEAMVSEPQAIVNISTISSSLEAGLGITAPEGARDRIVSTDQNFIVLANFQMHNVSNVKAKITLPVGYSTNENLEKNVVGSIVTWQVVAPSESQALSLIYLDANGVDALQPNVSVIAKTQTIDVTTINAAELVLTLSIISPDDAVDGTVSPGQEFVIQAELQNTGEAGITGQAVVSLSDLPEGYTIKGDEVLSKILVENFATWEIQAPVQATGTATIEARLTTVPHDENTNVSAKLGRGNDKIGVTVESAWLAVSTLPLPTDMSSSATVGQSWTKLMILEMDNRGEVGANRIRLESITFDVEDMYNDEISPRDVFSRLYIVNDEDSTQLIGSRSPLPNQNPVMVSLSQLLISTDTNMKLAIVGEITEDKGETYFQLNIPSAASIIAKDLDTGIDVLVADGTGEDFLNLRSLPQRIYDPDTEPLLWNSPNPFGQPGKEETQISFYINKLTSVDLKLFTLTGKLVWSQSLSQDLLEGSIGTTYQVTWDGRNDNQHMVLNGVYLLFLKMGDGEVRRTKIAVIK